MLAVPINQIDPTKVNNNSGDTYDCQLAEAAFMELPLARETHFEESCQGYVGGGRGCSFCAGFQR